MIVIYIVGIIFCLVLAVYFLDRREKMNHEMKKIQESRQKINELNQQLDEVQIQLNEIQGPLLKLNEISKKVLSYMKS